MLYRHEKTGVTIDVKSEMGGCWIPVTGSSESPKSAPKAPKPAGKTKAKK